MTVGEICMRETVVSGRQTSIVEIARLMRGAHVGSIVVVDDDGRTPVGVITDRDLVVEILATEIGTESVTAGDVMSADLITVEQDESVFDAVQTMRERGIRRMPVVDGAGLLVGIVTMDDLIEFLVEELSDLVRVVKRERMREAQIRQSA